MGCGDSAMGVQRPIQSGQAQNQIQNYNNNSQSMFFQMQNAKRPKFLNPQQLSQSSKDTLWAIIQRNSLKQFAYYIQNERIPSNVQVGPANTFWSFAHFCARWDAFECLQYVIKRIYAQKSTLLLSFMNQQSIEGFTPIHVAIQWNAINCFYLMLDCGGVDLSYTDKSNNDVFAKANLFKRTQMLSILEKFKAGDALMVLVQSQKARNFKDFSQLVASGQPYNRTEYRLTNQRLVQIIDSKNRLNRPASQIPPPIKTAPNKYEDLNNKMKEIEAQKKPNTSSQSYAQEEGNINMQKLIEQRKFQQDQTRIKYQHKQNVKRSVQMQREQEQARLRVEFEEQINKERIFQQTQLAKIQLEKQIMRKNIESMSSNVNQVPVNFGKPSMTCPEEIKPFYEAARAKGTKFVDTDFPATQSSLGNIADFKFEWKECVWLRPQQIFPGRQFQVFDGISPEDIKQGALSVCYYLALLSSIAQNQERIKKIFKFYDKELGFYALQFYLEGKPITMIVDDQFPCMRGTNEPLFSKPRTAQTWVMVFQKAWVKMFGSYLAAEKMSSFDMFENVLPAPCIQKIIDVSKIDQNFDQLVEYDRNNYIMTLTTIGNQTSPPGIVQEHAYSLIGAYNVNGHKICKIRNPWAKTEYEGMYAEQSPLWTQDLKSAVGFQKGDDGQFFLNPTQLQSIMPIVTISQYKDGYEYSWLEILSKSNQDLYYVINIKKKGGVAIKVTQQNARFNKNMEFQNSPIRLQVWKLGENFDARIVSEGEPSSMYHGSFSLYSSEDIFETLEPGRYLIRLKVMYDRTHHVSTRGTLRKYIRGTDGKNILLVREGKCVLSLYGPQSYVFNKIKDEQALKYLKNGFRNFILDSPSTSQRMKSVGQDLNPTVIAKDCKMRNQIIYYAQNLFPDNSINFSFKFQHEKFRNCSYAFNVNKETQSCDWVIEPGGWNLSTLQIDCPFQQVATDAHLQCPFKIIR